MSQCSKYIYLQLLLHAHESVHETFAFLILSLYTYISGFVNIWKEPMQAGLPKHLEAYDSGSTSGDIEYALINLFQYCQLAIYGCGENLKFLCPMVQSYVKRALQYNVRSAIYPLGVLHQLVYDLMGAKENALSICSAGMNEESLFFQSRANNNTVMCRTIFVKKKYEAFFHGDLEEAARAYDLCTSFLTPTTGRQIGIIVSFFIDGMIGFFHARKRNEDEAKWTNVGKESINLLRKWVVSSEWNFSNKLFLLEAEYYFLNGDDERAVDSYHNSIKAAHEHRFIHEEGLAEEKLASYLLRKSRHDEAMTHYVNAKKCYDAWGAQSVVDRIDKIIALLLPLCTEQRISPVIR